MYRFYLLATMAFVHYAIIDCRDSNGAEILSGPEHQVVAPYTKVSFYCIARGDIVFWQINESCPCNETVKDKFQERGFHFSQTGNHNKTISVEATFANNATVISCTALGESGGKFVSHAFQEGSLIVAGPPLAPSVDLNVRHLNSDAFTFTLNWRTPFTWSEFPIISYKIIMTNNSDEQPTTTVNITNGNFNQIKYTGRGSSCYTLTFSIEANNSLGKGGSTLIHSAQPTTLDNIGNLEISGTMLPNGVLQFWISFLAPAICAGYQTGTYNLTIFDNSSVVVDHFGPMKYTQENNSERTLVVKVLRSSLMPGSQYEVEVTVESLGIFRSQRKSVRTAASNLPCLEKQDSKQTIAIGSSVGVVFLFFTFISLVVILMVVYHRTKKRQEFDEADSGALPRRRVPSHKMEANPIYEGAMYETTPGESLKLLLNNTSKVDTEHVPHFSKAPSDPIAEEEVRYSGIQVAVETKPTAAIGNTFTYKRSHGDHDMTKNADDSSSMANVQAPYDGFEEEMTVCNFKIV